MGGDPSRHRPGPGLVDAKGRFWPCVHTERLFDPDSTVCLAGWCMRCGGRFHAPRSWERVRANRNEKLRAEIVKRDGPWCFYCSRLLGPALPATLDHVIPRAAGGSGDIANLVLACGPCNNRKADRLDVPKGAYIGVWDAAPGMQMAV